jgi:hypothetical protein
MAVELAAHRAVFQLPARHPASHLRHQQRPIAEPPTAQDHRSPRRFSQRKGGAEALVLAKKWAMPIHHWREALTWRLHRRIDTPVGADGFLSVSASSERSAGNISVETITILEAKHL